MSFFCPRGNKNSQEKRNYPVDAYVRSNDNIEDDVAQLSFDTNPMYLEIVEDYYPCSAMELPVKEGEIVSYVKSDGVWIYVRTENGADGYIPRRHCRLIDPQDTDIKDKSIDFGYCSNSRHDPQNRRASKARQSIVNDERRNSSNRRNRDKRHSHGHLDSMDQTNNSSYSPSSNSSSSSNHTMSHQSARPRVFSNLGVYRKFGTATAAAANNNNNNNQQNHSETSIRQQQHSIAVCGRKCGNQCEHKQRKNSKTMTPDKSSNNYGLHKSSVVSVSSGNSVSYENGDNDGGCDVYPLDDISEKTHQAPSNILYNGENEQEDNTGNLESHTSRNHRNDLEISNNVDQTLNVKDTNLSTYNTQDEINGNKTSTPDIIRSECGHPELIVIEHYRQQGDTDITVDRGDYAAIINDTKHKDWMYVVDERGERGFIPKRCAIKHECQNCTPEMINKTATVEDRNVKEHCDGDERVEYTNEDFETMERLIVIENYSGRNLDDLYACIGDTVYMNPEEQSGDKWFWVHSMKLKCSGYIPKRIAKSLAEIEQAVI